MKYVKGRLHRHGIGVVAVVHDQKAVCLYHMEPAADRLQALDPLFDLIQGQTVNPSYRRCRQSIVDHMDSGHGNKYGKIFLSQVDPAGYALQSPADDLIRINVTVFVQSEKYRADSFIFLNSTQLIVVAVQHNMAFRL